MRTLDELASLVLKELTRSLHSIDADQVRELARAVLKADRVFMAGRGRSGLHMRAFAMRLMHLGLRAFVVGDVTTPAIGVGDLLIIGSGSGRTASLIGHSDRASELGARVALITGTRGSQIEPNADIVVRILAPSPKTEAVTSVVSVQPMANLFEQSMGLLLDMLVMQLMEEMGKNADEMFTRHANLE